MTTAHVPMHVYRRHSKLDGVVEQLCGELLLLQPPTAQPPIMSGVRIGLELYDLLLNPDHVVRATETLTLENAVTLARQVEIDISLDRLSRQQEEGAAQLSAFMSERIGDGGVAMDSAPRQIWMPLLTVPRPLVPPIKVTDGDGRALPRPRQRDIRRPLAAALYHLLRNALEQHPDFGERDAPLTKLIYHDHPGRWLLQAALLQICDAGRHSPRSVTRAAALREGLVAMGGEGAPILATLLGHETNIHRRTALHAVQEVIAPNAPLVELIDLVHSGYLVVAGLDSARRHHGVTCSMPVAEARGPSAVRRFWAHNARTLDPREHNFTLRVHVPLPTNIRHYRLCLTAATEQDTGPLSVSLIPVIRYASHPAQVALDTIEKCADMLAAAPDEPPPREAEPERQRVQYLAGQGLMALESLERWAFRSRWEQASRDLGAKGNGTASAALERVARHLAATTAVAQERIAHVRRELHGLMSTDQRRAQVEQASAALRRTQAAFEDPLMRLELIAQEMPGTEVGRIHVDQQEPQAQPDPWLHPDPPTQPDRQPGTVEVWATISDESRSYTRAAVLPPLAIAMLIYLIGAFLLSSPLWWLLLWLDVDAVVEDVSATHPGAVVSLLLLIPAFALTRFRWTDRWNVAGLLRRPARLLVASVVAALCLAAIVLATQLGPASATPSDIWWVVGTLDAAFLICVVWVGWSILACRQRRRCVWRPKGLSFQRLSLDPLAPSETERSTRRWRRCRLLAYDQKAPDAVFDLTRPARRLDWET